VRALSVRKHSLQNDTVKIAFPIIETACIMPSTNGGRVMSSAVAESLLIGIDELAGLLTVSRRTIHQMDQRGHLPRCRLPIRHRKWDRREIEAWVSAGCPDRVRWEAIRAREMKRI
jgi:excisionase family DNA binding protein